MLLEKREWQCFYFVFDGLGPNGSDTLRFARAPGPSNRREGLEQVAPVRRPPFGPPVDGRRELQEELRARTRPTTTVRHEGLACAN